MKINPYDKREVAAKKKAFASTKKTVSPAAKDTNKTRRKETRSRIVGATVKTEKPKSNLKRDMRRPMAENPRRIK